MNWNEPCMHTCNNVFLEGKNIPHPLTCGTNKDFHRGAPWLEMIMYANSCSCPKRQWVLYVEFRILEHNIAIPICKWIFSKRFGRWKTQKAFQIPISHWKQFLDTFFMKLGIFFTSQLENILFLPPSSYFIHYFPFLSTTTITIEFAQNFPEWSNFAKF
jgi:hypothetical protein